MFSFVMNQLDKMLIAEVKFQAEQNLLVWFFHTKILRGKLHVN